MNSRTRSVALLAVPAILLTAAWLHAGPLDPPPGPIAGSGKTTQEIFNEVAAVEPRRAISATTTPGDADSIFRITTSGSYYLTANLTVPSGQSGIEILANNVTVDLMGFTISAFLPGSLDGIVEDTTNFSHFNIVVRNGTVSGLGGNGINLGDNSLNHRVERVNASNNGGMGIRFGYNGVVESCQAYSNASSGIVCFGSNSLIRSSTAYDNGGSGIILTGAGAISDCTSMSNTSVGFRTGAGATVSHCTARLNGFDGFDLGSTATIDSCAAYDNGGDGIDAAVNCTIINCTVAFSTGDGILAVGGGTVAGCSVYANTGDGIEVGSDALVERNLCDNNGNAGDGAGIHATGSDNRIEGNHCTDNDRGIDIDAAGNIIIRNTCASNLTAWDIAANNIFGPILDRRAPASGAVVGFSAASTLGSTDPNANFTY
ncbi:MAG: right-handed parallel beta-helix repeat-containing protein [Phycisphaerales bacterium]